jgi:hypothetical protein
VWGGKDRSSEFHHVDKRTNTHSSTSSTSHRPLCECMRMYQIAYIVAARTTVHNNTTCDTYISSITTTTDITTITSERRLIDRKIERMRERERLSECVRDRGRERAREIDRDTNRSRLALELEQTLVNNTIITSESSVLPSPAF